MSALEWSKEDKPSFRKWLSSVLKENTVNVTFTKKDGTERAMKCTLQENVVVPYEQKTDRKKEANDDVFAVWDVEKSAWRSFKIDSVKRIDMVA